MVGLIILSGLLIWLLEVFRLELPLLFSMLLYHPEVDMVLTFIENRCFLCSSLFRIENDTQNPDFITGNEIARIGIIENPQQFGSANVLTLDKASAVYALKLWFCYYNHNIYIRLSDNTNSWCWFYCGW